MANINKISKEQINSINTISASGPTSVTIVGVQEGESCYTKVKFEMPCVLDGYVTKSEYAKVVTKSDTSEARNIDNSANNGKITTSGLQVGSITSSPQKFFYFGATATDNNPTYIVNPNGISLIGSTGNIGVSSTTGNIVLGSTNGGAVSITSAANEVSISGNTGVSIKSGTNGITLYTPSGSSESENTAITQISSPNNSIQSNGGYIKFGANPFDIASTTMDYVVFEAKGETGTDVGYMEDGTSGPLYENGGATYVGDYRLPLTLRGKEVYIGDYELSYLKELINFNKEDNTLSFGYYASASGASLAIGAGAVAMEQSVSVGNYAGQESIGYDGGHNANFGSYCASFGDNNITIGDEAQSGMASNNISYAITIGAASASYANNVTSIGLGAKNSVANSLLLRASNTKDVESATAVYSDLIIKNTGEVYVKKSDGTQIDLSNSASSTDLQNHINDKILHITEAEREAWNEKQSIYTFDNLPESDSSNPVKSSGIFKTISSGEASSKTIVTGTSENLCTYSFQICYFADGVKLQEKVISKISVQCGSSVYSSTPVYLSLWEYSCAEFKKLDNLTSFLGVSKNSQVPTANGTLTWEFNPFILTNSSIIAFFSTEPEEGGDWNYKQFNNPVNLTYVHVAASTPCKGRVFLKNYLTSNSDKNSDRLPLGSIKIYELHTNDTTRHITSTERTKWNNKQDALTYDTAPVSGSTNILPSGGIYTAFSTKVGTSTTVANQILTMVKMTQTEYDALETKDENTFYVITE